MWYGDITYIWAGTGWLYLAVVLDPHARRVVAWTISVSPNTELVTRARTLSYDAPVRLSDVLFHSNRRCQYTKGFRLRAWQYRMTHSMSPRGNRWDTQLVWH